MVMQRGISSLRTCTDRLDSTLRKPTGTREGCTDATVVSGLDSGPAGCLWWYGIAKRYVVTKSNISGFYKSKLCTLNEEPGLLVYHGISS